MGDREVSGIRNHQRVDQMPLTDPMPPLDYMQMVPATQPIHLLAPVTDSFLPPVPSLFLDLLCPSTNLSSF